jgi:WD40 repeat protein
LASGGYGSNVLLWDTDLWKCARTLGKSHPIQTEKLIFSPDGKLLAGKGSHSGFPCTGIPLVSVWDTQSGKVLKSFAGHENWVRDIAFSPDSRMLVVADHEKSVHIWDTKTWECVRLLSGHEGEIHSVAFSPDGKYLATSGDQGEIIIWGIPGE